MTSNRWGHDWQLEPQVLPMFRIWIDVHAVENTAKISLIFVGVPTILPIAALALRHLQKSLHSRDLHSAFCYRLAFFTGWLARFRQPTPGTWDLRGHPSCMLSSSKDALEAQAHIGWLAEL